VAALRISVSTTEDWSPPLWSAVAVNAVLPIRLGSHGSRPVVAIAADFNSVGSLRP